MHNIHFGPDDEVPLLRTTQDRLVFLQALERKILWL
jgi:hypothetical protein